MDEFFTDVYAPRRLMGASRLCRDKYRRHIRWLGELLGRTAMVDDLTEEQISRLMQSQLDEGKAAATVNHLRAQMTALGNFAAKRGYLNCAPDISRIREPKRVPSAWTREELAKLFTACVQQRGYVAGIEAWKWWLALHCVLWDCGGRIGAVLKVKRSQINRDKRTLTLLAEHQKQDADQVFSLHADTIMALDAIDYQSREVVFLWTLCRDSIWNHYKRLLERAGLPSGRRDKFHKMRRSVASWFEAAGGDATKLLGHSSRRITMGYLDPTIVGEQQASNKLFRPGKPDVTAG